ncbi:hypothetical protein [Kitasatospora sp. NPDC057738]|uniref:hypothetical protein n=1 Tax=Kitasatospora sp. NPDC057738 TaxID=3346233 RepID=UPI0036B90A73
MPCDGAAARFTDLVSRRPAVMVLASLALLTALAGGPAGIRMDYGLGGGPRTTSRTTAAEISRALPAGVADPTSVHVETKGAGPLSPGALDGLGQSLTRVTDIGQVAKPVLSEDRQAARIDLFLTADSQSQQARDLLSGPIRAAPPSPRTRRPA